MASGTKTLRELIIATGAAVVDIIHISQGGIDQQLAASGVVLAREAQAIEGVKTFMDQPVVPDGILDLTNAQTASGVKVFSEIIVGPYTEPTSPAHLINKGYADNIGVVPIGAIISWHKSFSNTPNLPSNFVECNGQTLSDADSVYNGEVIPNLNGAAAGADLDNGDNLGKTGKVFLSGDEESGKTEFDAFQGHAHAIQYETGGGGNTRLAADGTGNSSSSSLTLPNLNILNPVEYSDGTPRMGANTVPRNMTIVYIMRIK